MERVWLGIGLVAEIGPPMDVLDDVGKGGRVSV